MKTKSNWKLIPPDKNHWSTRWTIYYGNIHICSYDSRAVARDWLKILKEEEKGLEREEEIRIKGIPPWE